MTFINNYFAMIYAIIFQSVLLSGYFFWAPKARNPEKLYNCWLVLGLRGVFFVIGCYLGFIFLDTSIKILFLGVYGYGNISFHITSCILLLVLGIELIIGAVFVAPTLKSITTFIVMLTLFIYYFEINQVVVHEDLDKIFIPMFYAIAFLIIITLIYEIYRKLKTKGFEDKELWNFERKFKRIFNWKFNLILWILLSIEIILMIEGYSLFFWLSYIF